MAEVEVRELVEEEELVEAALVPSSRLSAGHSDPERAAARYSNKYPPRSPRRGFGAAERFHCAR